MGHFRNIRSDLEDHERIDSVHAEALIDAMALVMCAEGELKNVEEREVERILGSLDERADLDAALYFQQAIDRAQHVAGDADQIRQWARQVAERLDSETLRDEAYYLSSRIAAIDVDVVSEETEILRTYIEVFDIPRQRLSRLTQRLREFT